MDEPLKPQSPLPAGYRQGVISAITVMIGFSLLFMRYWGFEVTGKVTVTSVAAGIVLMVAIQLQFRALWRALQPEDEQVSQYRRTLRWFMTSVGFLFASVALAALAMTGIAP